MRTDDKSMTLARQLAGFSPHGMTLVGMASGFRPVFKSESGRYHTVNNQTIRSITKEELENESSN